MLKSIFLLLSVCIVALTFNGGLEARVNPLISKGPNGSEAHIKDRHWHNVNPALKTSVFNKSIKMRNLSKIASVAINKGKHKVQGNGMLCHEYKFKNSIGKSSGGKAHKTLRVITDPKRSNGQNAYVVTAFPVQ